MTRFDGARLTPAQLALDYDGHRRGRYADRYFENIRHMLATLSAQGYTYAGAHATRAADPTGMAVGDLSVEMQWFTRHPGKTLVAGVDVALAILRECSGYFDTDGQFVNTAADLEIEAIHDGDWVTYGGDPRNIQPVIRVRGRYRDFALHETATLGVLSRTSRVATQVYHVLEAARGKPVLFFPARFDLAEAQAADGYAYQLAVQRFHADTSHTLTPFVSTEAQGAWWGGHGVGTVAHAAIAAFFGDTPETMLAFAATVDPATPRIALVDFNNDSIGDALAVMSALFERYRQYSDAGDESTARRYILNGIRLDTSGSLRDISLPPLGDKALDLGVNARLVFTARTALDSAWQRWNLPPEWQARAADYCRNVQIVVSGGFNVEKITRFEQLGAPVDVYGVGSSLFSNDNSFDFTADVVRAYVHGQLQSVAKVGRQPGDNPLLQRVG